MELPKHYYGGKGQAGPLRRIVNQFPPHEYYIEPFLGRGRVFEAKTPALKASFGFELSMGLASGWVGRADIQFRCADGIEGTESLLKGFEFGARVLIYADPPYLFDVRKSDRPVYAREWSEDDHREFLARVKAWSAMVAISHPVCPLYASELAGWRRIEYQSQTRGGMMDECLWMNYPSPDRLHESTYFGDSFRERQRTGKGGKAEIIDRRLSALPRPLALAILERLQDRYSRDGARE